MANIANKIEEAAALIAEAVALLPDEIRAEELFVGTHSPRIAALKALETLLKTAGPEMTSLALAVK